jgi:hypothetical protein
MSPSQQQEDPFDTLLSLESQYHAEGLALGIAEGTAAGRIEGRVFGLEKSFEKFIELGRLRGRATVWNARLPGHDQHTATSPQLEVGKEEAPRSSDPSDVLGVLPGSGSERLVRHVKRLVELTDSEDVSRENSEDGVQDFDDRLREAKAKAVLVERLVGEGGKENAGGGTAVKRAGVKSSGAKSSEMEDFGGLPKSVLQK